MEEELTSETDFVNWVETMITLQGNLLGHREDAIAVNIGDAIMVVNIDGWVESTDRPSGMSAKEVGFRAVANAISDVIVKGARPSGMIISSTISDQHKSQLKDIIRGFNDASTVFGVPFFGGDMNAGNDLVIDVTVWGLTERLVRRDGAASGDKIYWLGPALGSTATALGILTQGWSGSQETALNVMGRPKLFPEFLSYKASSATDSSDGLARSLYLLAEASEKRFDINFDQVTPEKWIQDVAVEENKDIKDLYLYGGEELGIVFTYSRTEVDKDPLKLVNCIEIGTVRDGNGVYMDDNKITNRGWDHFSD